MGAHARMGCVSDASFWLQVAIKTLSRERYRELNMVFPPQEIRLLERVRHPNLMRMLETIWTEDDIYLVLELIDGGEFFEYCSAAGRLNEVRSVPLLF